MDQHVTLGRPTGETKTFGPMPARDALLVALAAHASGHGARIHPVAPRS